MVCEYNDGWLDDLKSDLCMCNMLSKYCQTWSYAKLLLNN